MIERSHFGLPAGFDHGGRVGLGDDGRPLDLVPGVQFVAQVDNVFDTRYDTAAQLGPTAFTSAGTPTQRAANVPYRTGLSVT